MASPVALKTCDRGVTDSFSCLWGLGPFILLPLGLFLIAIGLDLVLLDLLEFP